MATVKANPGIERPFLISPKTIGILACAADASKNPVITINSGIRSALRQASEMYNNLANGKRIAYAAPGREVVRVYDDNKGLQKAEVVPLMEKKINALSAAGLRVSLHCVAEAEYQRLNIVDVDRGLPNPRDFVKELVKSAAVTRVITPFTSVYNSTKVAVDGNEPAIHVEVRQ